LVKSLKYQKFKTGLNF